MSEPVAASSSRIVLRRPSWLRSAKIVAAKELRDGARDRRAILSALLYPLLGPVMLLVTFRALLEMAAPTSIRIGVDGREHAPDLIAAIEADERIEIVEGHDELRAMLEREEISAYLVVADDFADDFEHERPANVQLAYDGSRRGDMGEVNEVRKSIGEWIARQAIARLQRRSVDPTMVAVVDLQDLDHASKQARSAVALAFVPLFLVLAAFFGGLQLAVDTTAGEKERRSLEPLLLTPTQPSALAAGKWTAACVFALVSVVATSVGYWLALRSLPLDQIGLELEVGPVVAVSILLIAASVAPLACGLQLWLASRARNAKEAQVWLSLLMLVPTLPATWLSLQPSVSSTWLSFVPMLGQQQLIMAVLSGRAVTLVQGLALMVQAVLCTGLLVWLTGRGWWRERIIFSQ